jgi:hypothetical protein
MALRKKIEALLVERGISIPASYVKLTEDKGTRFSIFVEGFVYLFKDEAAIKNAQAFKLFKPHKRRVRAKHVRQDRLVDS